MGEIQQSPLVLILLLKSIKNSKSILPRNEMRGEITECYFTELCLFMNSSYLVFLLVTFCGSGMRQTLTYELGSSLDTSGTARFFAWHTITMKVSRLKNTKSWIVQYSCLKLFEVNGLYFWVLIRKSVCSIIVNLTCYTW